MTDLIITLTHMLNSILNHLHFRNYSCRMNSELYNFNMYKYLFSPRLVKTVQFSSKFSVPCHNPKKRKQCSHKYGCNLHQNCDQHLYQSSIELSSIGSNSSLDMYELVFTHHENYRVH